MVDFKTSAQEIYKQLRGAKSVLLHFHPSPDPDSVGSALAMKHVLEGWGVKATVIRGDSPLPRSLSCFPGFGTVLDKNFTEINLADFDLFLMLDISQPNRVTSLAPIVFPPHLKTILVDHHRSGETFARINLIDPDFSSTSELLFCLLKEWQVVITHDTALCLFAGIWGDTGSFKYHGTKSRTFLAAAELAKIAPDFTDLIFKLENSRIPEELYFNGLAFSSIEIHGGGRVAVVALPYSLLAARGLAGKFSHLEISNHLKSVVGWDIGVSLVEQEPGVVRVSLRTRDAEQFDLSRLAVALGGGGHKAAAGALLRQPFTEAKQLFLDKLVEIYPVLK